MSPGARAAIKPVDIVDDDPVGLEAREGLAVDAEDDVARLQARLLGRAALEHLADDRPRLGLEFEERRHLPVHGLEPVGAEPGERPAERIARDPPQVREHLAGHEEGAALLNVHEHDGGPAALHAGKL